MTSYFDGADASRILREYPIGEDFLNGPAKLSRDELRNLQEQRFQTVMRRAWDVAFYQSLWGDKGIEPGDIRGLDDIAKLPSFSKSDLMASIEKSPPFGDYHGVDFADPANRPHVVFHTTSGTTGRPQPLFFGAWDREVQNVLLARTYRLQGIRDDDVMHSVYGFGMVNGGHYVREGVLHFTKAVLLTAGTGLETRSEQQVALMRDFGVTAVVGFVDYIKRLAEVALENGIVPGRDIPVRLICGHMGQESREQISEAWGGADVFDWYGVGDTGAIAAEGPEQDGLYLWEDAQFVEIIDADTHDSVPDGEAGNICCTCLFKHTVYPVIRFNTNDVTRIVPGHNGSGINFRRIEGFRGRSDNMVKLRGVNVYPTSVGAALLGIDALTGEFICRLDREGTRDEMTVIIEAKEGVARDDLLADRVAALLRQKLGVQVSVELVGPGETAPLTEVERRQKAIRLIDTRFK